MIIKIKNEFYVAALGYGRFYTYLGVDMKPLIPYKCYELKNNTKIKFGDVESNFRIETNWKSDCEEELQGLDPHLFFEDDIFFKSPKPIKTWNSRLTNFEISEDDISDSEIVNIDYCSSTPNNKKSENCNNICKNFNKRKDYSQINWDDGLEESLQGITGRFISR